MEWTPPAEGSGLGTQRIARLETSGLAAKTGRTEDADYPEPLWLEGPRRSGLEKARPQDVWVIRLCQSRPDDNLTQQGGAVERQEH